MIEDVLGNDMSNAVDQIPAALKPAAEAALAWVNQKRDAHFQLTGLVGADVALAAKPGEAVELGLILCDGEFCLRQQVQVQPDGDGYQFNAVAAGDAVIPAHLDPPQGIRQRWLEERLAKHAFVIILFYRGLW